MADTAESIPNPKRTVPRATYLALAIAGGLCVLISIGVYGTLTVDEVIASGDTALAEAAKPALGDAAFMMMAIAARLATASSVNANVFAAGGITANLAETGQFPSLFGGRASVFGSRGVTISVAIVLLLVNFLDLSTIASIGSAVALVIFALVVFVLFTVDAARNAPRTFIAMLVIGALTVIFDFLWKRRRGQDQQVVPS